MRVLVTGCAGFIGSQLTEALLADGAEVLGIDCFNNNYGRKQKLVNLERSMDWDGFEFVPVDLSRGELGELVDGCEVVFHLAAEPGVRNSWGPRFETYVRNNLVATQHLLEAVAEHPVRRLVYASSSSVYGQVETYPTPEDVLPAPFSPYGVTKLGAELLCGSYHANHGVDVVTLRYFSVFGPRQRPDMGFNIFCRAALNGAPIEIYGDGEQTRDFTYVDDVVTATVAAADAPGVAGQVFNIGGGAQTSINEALEIVSELAGRPLDIRYTAREHGDVRATGADTTRAREQLGFLPRTSLRDGLQAQFDWIERASWATT
jgi:UDP-glucuronate 4-epimerase